MELLKVLFEHFAKGLLNPEKKEDETWTDSAKIRFAVSLAALMAGITLLVQHSLLGFFAVIVASYYAGTKNLTQSDLIDWVNDRLDTKEATKETE